MSHGGVRGLFAKDDARVLLNIYLTAGLPDPARAGAYARAAAAGGADVLELGFPFNDPIADGPTLQEAARQALAAGTTVERGLETLRLLRREAPDVGRIVMTYANIAHRPGFETFAQVIVASGAEALILPDVPLEESGPLRKALAQHDVAFVPVINPATPPHRIARVAATADAFLYVAGALGVTGQESPGPLLEATLHRARAAAPATPLLAGFGLSRPPDIARAAKAGARGVVVGSAVARSILDGATPQQVQALVATYRSACDAAGPASAPPARPQPQVRASS